MHQVRHAVSLFERIPRLHELLRLRKDGASTVGVAAVDRPWEADIIKPTDLPEHLVEIHTFNSTAEAEVFREGVTETGSNRIAVSETCGPHRQIVLAARFDREQPNATTLDDAVRVVHHPRGSEAKIVREWSDRIEGQARQDALALDVLDTFSDVSIIIRALPNPRAKNDSEFAWHYAKLSEFRDSKGRPNGLSVIEGTLDPDPSIDGLHPVLHFEHMVIVARLDDGSLELRIRSGIGREDSDGCAEICREHGWDLNGVDMAVFWRGQAGPSLGKALMAVPRLVSALTDLSASKRLGRLIEEMVADPGCFEALALLLAHPDGRIIRQDFSGSAHAAFVFGNGESEPVLVSACLKLMERHYIENVPMEERGRNVWVQRATEMGLSIALAVAVQNLDERHAVGSPRP